MSQGKREPGRDDLPLPAPTSPSELDDRILSYARRMTPERRSMAPRWAAGLASVGVVLLAVFIAQPQRQPPAAPGNVPAADQSAPATPAAKGPVATSPRTANRASAERDLKFAREADAGTAAPLLADAPQAAARAPAETTAHGSMGSLTATLARCAELLANGEGPRARETYQRLRRDCPECNLPATLEQALEQHPPARGKLATP